MSSDGTILGRFTGKGIETFPMAGPNELGSGGCAEVTHPASNRKPGKLLSWL
jgi:hypothetical protein